MSNPATKVPTEYINGSWIFPDAVGPEPLAVVTYTQEPSPETGHVGWVWWALGRMGEAVSYDAAKRAAEDCLRRKEGDEG